MTSISELRQALDAVLTRERARLAARLRALGATPDAAALVALTRDIQASAQRRAARAASVPATMIDEALPIARHADDIIAAICTHQVLILAGETGSGKTTQLPKLCLAAGRGVAGMIGCTQPRRLAARAVARRVAEELGTEVGALVGFQVRFNEQVGERALVKFMTDGILLAETRGDRALSAYDTLVLDEAHERSLNIDFLLGYLKRLLQRRADLKLIITSATLDTARFAQHFGDAPVVSVEGRGHPVELRWRPPQGRGEADLPAQVAAALDEITSSDGRGDVLVFLPGEREIREVHLALERRRYRHTEVLPLYARLSASEQDRVFHPGAARRVVLATNVAETSLTVPRIRYVIDSGSARVKRYSARSQIERLYIEPIAQSAAEQRKGRCGRVGPGVCVRLYAEEDFSARPRYGDPELKRSALSGVILRMLSLGLGEVESFPFIDAPEPRAWAEGWRRLAEIGAVDDARKLTRIGRDIAALPLDAGLARMLVEGQRLDVAEPLRVLVAFLSIQDPRERPADARAAADAAHATFIDKRSDFLGVLNLWAAYQQAHEDFTQSKLRDWCERHFLSFLRMREWRELHRQLRVLEETRDSGLGARDSKSRDSGLGIRDSESPAVTHVDALSRQPARVEATSAMAARRSIPEFRVPSPESRKEEALHCALLAGLPTQVAHKDEKGGYRGTRERRWQIFPGSALAKAPPPWLFSAQVLDLNGRVYGMMNARLEPAWIERQAAHLLKRAWFDPRWSRARGAVLAFEQVSLFGLNLAERRTVQFQRQDPAQAHAIFLEQALAECALDARADFLAANRRVLAEAERIEARQRRAGLLKSATERAQFFAGKLPESIASAAALGAWYKQASAAQRAALHWSLDDLLEADAGAAGAYPAALDLAGQHLPLEYRYTPGSDDDGITLRVPLALLNALPEARLQWLVPGLLAEKIAEMIRGLPRSLRRNFVPAPDFARAFCAAEAPRDEALGRALAAYLRRVSGVAIGAEDFAGIELPPHLRLRVLVRDGDGATLDAGRDLATLRARWSGAARNAFAQHSAAEVQREDVAGFDFEEIPLRVHGAGGLDAFPALVDQGGSVALRVFERSDEAAAAHRHGVMRLLRLALATEIKRAARQLPLAQGVALRWAPLGDAQTLRAEVVEGALDALLQQADVEVRTRGAFSALRDALARELFGAAMMRLQSVEAVVSAQAELRPWLEPPLPGFARASYDDLHEQLDLLLAPDFLRTLEHAHLAELPRYLKAMCLRAKRLRQDPARDQRRMLEVLPFWRRLLALRAQGCDGAAWHALRWLLEEWRVSLFAQELGTAQPVSLKRIQRALADAEAEPAAGAGGR
ncbi:MAG: ATP-dependent RNA helicase HrpA [Metallibacterium sp.]